jgi:hypothetical protein
MKVPEQYYDEVFHFRGQWDMPSCCGLKITAAENKTTVIVTELYQDNPGTSVAAAGKNLAEQICAAKGLSLEEIRYIECNPGTSSKLSFYDEEFFEVDFSGAAEAAYRQLSPEEVRAL